VFKKLNEMQMTYENKFENNESNSGD